LPQALAGTYTLTVGPEVLDLTGNVMNRNGDALQGDGYSSSFSVEAPPATIPFAFGV
jgi:hypothetical protein